MLKLIAITFGLFALGFAFAAQALPHRLSGHYRFSGFSVPVARLTFDVIDLRAPSGEERLRSLRDRGSDCRYIESVTVRCLSQNPASSVPETSLRKIARDNRNLAVYFGEETAPPKKISSGQGMVEYVISQSGEWADQKFTGYRYLEIGDRLARLILPGIDKPLDLTTIDGRALFKMSSLIVSESRWRWHRDVVNLKLTGLSALGARNSGTEFFGDFDK